MHETETFLLGYHNNNNRDISAVFNKFCLPYTSHYSNKNQLMKHVHHLNNSPNVAPFRKNILCLCTEIQQKSTKFQVITVSLF